MEIRGKNSHQSTNGEGIYIFAIISRVLERGLRKGAPCQDSKKRLEREKGRTSEGEGLHLWNRLRFCKGRGGGGTFLYWICDRLLREKRGLGKKL